jgi:copper resistance protein D
MESALVVCRTVHYTSVLLVFGACVFQAGLATDDLASHLEVAMRRWLATGAALALLSALGWLALVSGEMGRGWPEVTNPAVWLAVLGDTEFGEVWTWHLLLAAALAVLVLLRGRTAHRLAALAASLAAASLGLVGHAVMPEGPAGLFSRASQVLHLWAGGFWLGALVPLLWCLARIADPAQRNETMIALRRFSAFGHLAVATVILTGIANTAFILKRMPTDLASPYQRLLLIKAAAVAGMVALALANRYVLVPRWRKDPDAVKWLRILTSAELVLGLGAVAIVSWFGTLNPH